MHSLCKRTNILHGIMFLKLAISAKNKIASIYNRDHSKQVCASNTAINLSCHC